jgi:hypothetical protein
MKSDLRNFVSAQEGHFADFATYATAIDATAGCTPAAATVCFAPTVGNTFTPGVGTAGGFNATATNASLSTAKTCGVFGGNAAAPNAAVVQEGAPACW